MPNHNRTVACQQSSWLYFDDHHLTLKLNCRFPAGSMAGVCVRGTEPIRRNGSTFDWDAPGI